VSGEVSGSAFAFKANKSALDKPELLHYASKSEGMFVGESLIFRFDSNGEDLEGYAGVCGADMVVCLCLSKRIWDCKLGCVSRLRHKGQEDFAGKITEEQGICCYAAGADSACVCRGLIKAMVLQMFGLHEQEAWMAFVQCVCFSRQRQKLEEGTQIGNLVPRNAAVDLIFIQLCIGCIMQPYSMVY